MYGPVRTVVWEGRSREAPPYPDQVLTIPIGILGAGFLVRAWWLQLSHGLRTAWQWRSLLVLLVSTATAATLWGLRFAGVIG